MIRTVLLSLAAAGLPYAAYASLGTSESEFSDRPTKISGSEVAQVAQETPWTKIDLAAQNSPHAIVPEQDLTFLPIRLEKEPPLANAQATSAIQQAEHIRVTSPASVREGPSTSTAIIGIAQPGAEAQVVSRQADWVQIIDPDSKKTGWVQSSFLESQSQPGSRALSKEEVEAALDPSDEVDSSAPETSKSSVGPRKSQKHGSRHSHRKRGFAFKFLFRRAW
jgi:uncharacterized protein YraI